MNVSTKRQQMARPLSNVEAAMPQHMSPMSCDESIAAERRTFLRGLTAAVGTVCGVSAYGGVGEALGQKARPLPGQTGLIFASNHVSGSDIRLEWAGANLLPRTSHTAIWTARYIHQLGYYAVTWHTSNDGSWHASLYEFGAHPYPTTGSVDSTGQSTGGLGSSGETQYYEIAGLGASDFIASPGPGETFPVVKDVWVRQARTCKVVNGDTLRHRFWPDLSRPAKFIQQDVRLADYQADAAKAVSPTFVFGCSPWTASGNVNGETPSGTFRAIKLFDAALPIADIVSESSSGSDLAVTSSGRTSVWYINENPTPKDISDKSGASHSPRWANANRPRLFRAA